MSTSELKYEYYSLRFTSAAGPSSKSGNDDNIQRCAAILGSDVILPEGVIATSQESGPEAGPCAAGPHSCRPGREQLYMVDGGGGMGMFSQTCIPQGGVILVEHPVAILPADMSKVDYSFDSGSGPMEALFALDDDKARKGVPAVASKDTSNINTLAEVFHTNALDIELKAGSTTTSSQYKALFRKTSRCNHRQVHHFRFQT